MSNAYEQRGWIQAENEMAKRTAETNAKAELMRVAESQISNWKKMAEMAKRPGAHPELAQQVLSSKAELDSLLVQAKQLLNEQDIKKLETALGDTQTIGKGRTKKRKSRRRRNRKSTHRRKSTRRYNY